MKLRSLLLVIAGLTTGFAGAASVSLTNANFPTFSAFLSSAGVPISGVVTIGTYSSEPTSALNVLNGYTSLGSLGFGTANGGVLDGYAQGAVNVSLPLGSAAVGQQVYIVVGNAATLAASTEFLVWKPTSNSAGNTFTADNPVGGPDSVLILGSTGTTVVGNFGFVADIAGSGSQGHFRLAAVPEPSAMLLGAVGALGLLRRRR